MAKNVAHLFFASIEDVAREHAKQLLQKVRRNLEA